MKGTLAALLGASLLLAGCEQSSSPAATSSPSTPPAAYGDGLDHSWTATTVEGQQLYAALSSGLKTQDLNLGVSVTASNGWGPIEFNTSNGETASGDGKPITLNGQTYATGLGVHAGSEIHIHATNLETPACTRFQSDVGVDDEVGNLGSVVFQVYADGVKLFDSGVMTGASATQHIDVAIGNKSDLRFVVTDADGNIDYDHADWAGATLTCQTQTTRSVTLDTTSLNVYHLHTGTLHATFNNYPKGPVQLDLTSDPFGDADPFNSRDPFPLVLQTTQVELTGLPSETKDIVITAPQPGTFANNAKFFLTITASGTATQSLPVTLRELPINFTARFEPSNLSGRDGETENVVLVVTADPPLNSAQSIAITNLGLPPELADSSAVFQLATVGSVTGTGSEMRRAVTVKFNRNGLPDNDLPYVDDTRVGIQVGNITTGYRDPF